MQIGSASALHATSRLSPQASRTQASPRIADTAADGGGVPLSGAATLLSYMTGQTTVSNSTANTPISTESLRAWTRELSDSDRQLVETISGLHITENGDYTDADGTSTAPTLSQSAIVAALSLMRSEQSAAEARQPVTGEQYDALCDRAQVALFQAGSLFDPAARQKGHDAVAGNVSAPSSEADTPLPAAVRNHVTDLVEDPDYAMKAVEQYAKRPLAMMVKLPVPENGGEGWVDPQVVQASYDRWMGYYQTVNAAHAQAQTLFEQGRAAGKSGAEIYADILRDQVAQPDTYWLARDPDLLGGVSRSQTTAELKALETAIAAKRKA